MALNSWTNKDLEALDFAIATGARKVKYTDKEIEYRSLDEMIRSRNLIAKALGISSGSKRLSADYSKGTE